MGEDCTAYREFPADTTPASDVHNKAPPTFIASRLIRDENINGSCAICNLALSFPTLHRDFKGASSKTETGMARIPNARLWPCVPRPCLFAFLSEKGAETNCLARRGLQGLSLNVFGGDNRALGEAMDGVGLDLEDVKKWPPLPRVGFTPVRGYEGPTTRRKTKKTTGGKHLHHTAKSPAAEKKRDGFFGNRKWR
jgi:hypothetical protein